MGTVVDRCQVLEVQVGVNLGGLDVRVAEQFLHGAQILRGFKQVAGEGVTQHVGVQVLPQLTLAGSLDPHLNRPWAEAPPGWRDSELSAWLKAWNRARTSWFDRPMPVS